MKLLEATRPTFIVLLLRVSQERIDEVGRDKFPLQEGEQFLEEEARGKAIFLEEKRNCDANGIFDDVVMEGYVFVDADRSASNENGECEVIVRFELLRESVGCFNLFRACMALVEDTLWQNVQVFRRPKDENEKITDVVEMNNPLPVGFSASKLTFGVSAWW